jgi:hypothetical protein
LTYYQQEPEKEPGGCRESFVLTRAVFGVLMWPLLALLGAMVGLGIVLYLFFVNPLLALIPIGLLAVGLFLFARWESKHLPLRKP